METSLFLEATDIFPIAETECQTKTPPSPKNTSNKYRFPFDLTGCFLAGGALTSHYTGKVTNDFDIYPKTKADRDSIVETLFDEYHNYHASDRALTFVKDGEIPIQVMIFDVFPTAQSIFDYFDFTVNMAAYDFDTDETIMDENFLVHNSQRYLHINPNTKYPYATVLRIKKYEERGYKINQGQMLKILMSCANSPIQSWEELKNQIGGIYGDSIVVMEDQPFSTDAAINTLDNLIIAKNPKGYSSYDDYIIATSNDVKFYKNQNQLSSGYHAFILNENGEYDIVYTSVTPKPEQITTLNDLYPSGKIMVYKGVYHKDGEYFSKFKPSYKYQILEEARSDSPYLWFRTDIKSAYEHVRLYGSNEKREAVLKAIVKVEDITSFSPQEIIAKKAFIVDEVAPTCYK